MSDTTTSLPAKWRVTSIGSVCSKPQYGWTTSAADFGEVKLLRTTDITRGPVDWSSVPFCQDAPPDVEKYLLAEGDIVVSRAGSVGVSCRVIAPERAVFASYLIRFRPKEDVDGKYLTYVLQSPAYWAQVRGSTAGIAIPNVNASKLEAFTFPLAPLPEQRRIVAEIEKQFTRLEAGVAALRRVHANLKRYRAAVLKAACEGRLVPTEADLAKTGKRKAKFETGEALLVRILTERRQNWQGRGPYREPATPDAADLPHIPEGWTWARAEQLCGFITKGTTPSAENMQSGQGEIPFIKVYNLTFTGVLNSDYKPVFISRKTHEDALARSEVRSGDILINIVGPPLGQVSIVPATIVEANINQAIARFRVVLPECRKLLGIWLMAEPIVAWAMKRAKTTAGQSNLTLELCRDLPIPLPPLPEQTRIVA